MTETLVELGIPGFLGAAIGAVIAHYSAKARGREEHQRTIDLLVTQDERRTALAMLDAARELRVAHSTHPIDLGDLHNQWSDRILAPSRIIRDQEIRARARAGLYMIALALLMKDDYTTYAVLRGFEDVEEWLEAWLIREDPPAAHLPPMEELGPLVRESGTGRVAMDRLTELLTSRA